MENLVQQLINGISLGSIYALIALGYTMVYGVIKLIKLCPRGHLYGGRVPWLCFDSKCLASAFSHPS